MLYTELARAAANQITEQTLWELANPESKELIDLLEDEKQAFGGEFIVRLERIVRSLETVSVSESSETFHAGISEALHIGALAKLRTTLAKVLSRKREVLLLIDNLDKPWTRHTDLEQLADFLLGLLTATNRVGEELNRGDRIRAKAKFNSAIFLRSDIFERVITAAREPDKLAYTRIRWEDSELLLRVIEERYVTAHGPGSDPSTMWRRYFCPQVKGIPTREYLTSRILKRPRDIVYFVKAVVSFAVNRKHDRVEEKDVIDGEKQYSQYALDSILVENGITVPQLESVLFEFVGAPAILPKSHALRLVSQASIPAEQVDDVVDHLVKLSFLGVEVSDRLFAYSDEPRELKKNKVLSDRFIDGNEENRRYEINPPFRSYLEISET